MKTAELADSIGGYHLLHFIGRGGCGECWSAVKPSTVGSYALKVLLPELAASETGREMFEREAMIAAQLGRHGNIVRVHDFGREGALPYLVMDLVDGINLRRFVRECRKKWDHPLPMNLVVYVIRMILRAVGAAHTHTVGGARAAVVHGDIKPANILVSSHGEIQLTDFGIARFAALTPFISRPVGTLRYMAPEQYLGRIAPLSDLYSVGAVLHDLLTGEPPVPADVNPKRFERALLSSPIPPVGRTDVPPAVENLRRGLLEKSDVDRIQSAAEALRALKGIGSDDPQTEMQEMFARLVGPPRSGVTQYLQRCNDGPGSFLAELVRPALRRPVLNPDEPTHTAVPKPSDANPDLPIGVSRAEARAAERIDTDAPRGPAKRGRAAFVALARSEPVPTWSERDEERPTIRLGANPDPLPRSRARLEPTSRLPSDGIGAGTPERAGLATPVVRSPSPAAGKRSHDARWPTRMPIRLLAVTVITAVVAAAAVMALLTFTPLGTWLLS